MSISHVVVTQPEINFIKKFICNFWQKGQKGRPFPALKNILALINELAFWSLRQKYL